MTGEAVGCVLEPDPDGEEGHLGTDLLVVKRSSDRLRDLADADELCRLPVASTDADLVRRAITTSRRWRLAVWDALIVEAARSSGCDRILTEDLQDGQDFDGVTVESPF